MSEASFASLGPTLLARKGGAKPAMRPQVAPLPEDVEDEALEDLGWNDMGQDDENGADVVPITPDTANQDALEAASPVVKRQQKNLEDRVLADAAMEGPEAATDDATVEAAEPAITVAKKPRKTTAKKPAAKGRRAAFTLRLDTDRHLKLRLAATMQGKSAQAVVTEALDALLDQIDDIDALAQRMKRT
ncbi:hypothetical protein [uncultured Erythrobacter sp.]|uniref:hypothetical protein n=1 Tax=uncultured Erythrobacter sp. TaxID=263913 RepID=UPI00261CB6D4|nr:hypothetical protein [uncultured Erythrobacter sp.]